MQHIEKPGDNDKKTDKPRSVYIATYGCQMNLRDAEAIKGMLLEGGFEIIEEEKGADTVLFVTCSVRQHAEDKVWSEIGRIAKARWRASGRMGQSPQAKGLSPQGTVPIIGLVGCMAENYKEDAFKRMPGIDLVVGTNNIGEIPKLLKTIFNEERGAKGEGRFLAVRKKERDEFVYEPAFREAKDNSFVVISEGCDNFCSYCVVPYVRGRLRHRKPEHILQEIERCIEKEVTSITLIGQNVNAYGAEHRNQSAETRNNDIDFIRLLELVNRIEGLKEFSFVTSHPKDASFELFTAMAKLAKLKKYLHLPFQSASNRILGLMKRGYTKEHYLQLAEEYRKRVPGGELTTDIIVGFPSETEEDFKETLDLVQKVRFNGAYIFKYSLRPHAEAGKLKDDVPKQEKERRHKILLETQKRISAELKAKR